MAVISNPDFVTEKLLIAYQQLIERLNVFPKLSIKKRRSKNWMVVFDCPNNFAYLTLVDNDNPADQYLKLVISLPEKLKHPRIKVITQSPSGRFSHQVVISSVVDIDDQLIDWLEQAYLSSI